MAGNDQYDEYSEYLKIAVKIYYAHFAFVVMAMISSVLTIVVLAKSTILSKTATGDFVLALAAAQFIEAFTLGLLTVPNLNILDHSEFVCRVTFLLHYTGYIASKWLTVVLVAERIFTRTMALFRRPIIMRPLISRVIISIIFFISVGLGSHPLWTIKPGRSWNSDCLLSVHNFDFDFDHHTWHIIVYMLPIIQVTILTVWLVVVEFVTRNRRWLNQQYEGDSSVAFVQLQLFYITLVVAVPFVILSLPMDIMINGRLRNSLIMKLELAIQVMYLLIHVYNAVKFVLFCVFSLLFRQELKALLGYGRRERAPQAELVELM